MRFNVAELMLQSAIYNPVDIENDPDVEEVDDEGTATNSADIEKIRAKRLVFIIDEAHRSTFGDMLIDDVDIFINLLQIRKMAFGLRINRIKELEEQEGGTCSEQSFILSSEGQMKPGHGFEKAGVGAATGAHD